MYFRGTRLVFASRLITAVVIWKIVERNFGRVPRVDRGVSGVRWAVDRGENGERAL